jgi:hypothetical protein
VAIYSTPTLAHPYADEVGCTIKWLTGPDMTSTTDTHISVYFAAMQFGFRKADNSSAGGGHLGLIWGDYPRPGHAVLNCGIYDDTYGVTNSVTRGSIPTHYELTGGPASYDWNRYGVAGRSGWDYGDEVTFRVFRSPKQNWLAAQLDNGSLQPPEYTSVDQKTSGTYGAETAFRCVVQRNNEAPFFFRDVLIKSAATSAALTGPSFFLEPIFDNAFISVGSWPFNPSVQFRAVAWDGCRCVKSWTLTYGPQVNSDQTLITDGSSRQWLRYTTNDAGLTRTNADGTGVTMSNAWWPTPPSNVSPAITDNAARVTTPRPWF